METDSTISCPVCGRPAHAGRPCGFCGADLRAPSSQSLEPSSAPQAGAEPPGPSGPSLPTSGFPAPWQAPPAAQSALLAGFWIRAVAYIMDSVLVGLATRLLQAAYFQGARQDPFAESYSRLLEFDWTPLAPLLLFEIAMNFLYFTFFIGRYGQTPGKMVCGLRVVTVHGEEVSYLQAALRTAGYYLNRLTLGLGFLWVAIDPRKQGFHDKIAGTLVLRASRREAGTWQPPQTSGLPGQGRFGGSFGG